MNSNRCNGFFVILETEFRRITRSRRFLAILLVTVFPAVIYLFNPEATGKGLDAMLEAYQSLMAELVPSYWLGVIGQLLAIILMSDLLASEIDKGTIRLLLAKPVKMSEIIMGKFAAGILALTTLFIIPYIVIWLYNPVVYGTGYNGLAKSISDVLLVAAATILVLAALGSLSMMVSALITRSLYASLVSFGIVFLSQYIIPQIPYVENPSHYTIGYQVLVILKEGFERINLQSIQGNSCHTIVFFSTLTTAFLAATWVFLTRRDFTE